MSTKQIESCTERLRQVDGYVAEEFRLMMREAAKLHAQANTLRREAWASYRETLGLVAKGENK